MGEEAVSTLEARLALGITAVKFGLNGISARDTDPRTSLSWEKRISSYRELNMRVIHRHTTDESQMVGLSTELHLAARCTETEMEIEKEICDENR